MRLEFYSLHLLVHSLGNSNQWFFPPKTHKKLVSGKNCFISSPFLVQCKVYTVNIALLALYKNYKIFTCIYNSFILLITISLGDANVSAYLKKKSAETGIMLKHMNKVLATKTL